MISALLTSSSELESRLPQLTGGALRHIEDAVAREDHENSLRKRNPADRLRALSARAALRLIATHRTGRNLKDAAQLDIQHSCRQCGGPHGRPELDGVSLSSSSSARHVLAAAAEHRHHVGVDLEAIPEQVCAGFDEYALHPTERRIFSPTHGEQADQKKIEYWVLKEAVLKAAGVGLTLPPAQLLLGGTEATTLWHSANSSTTLRWRPVKETPDSDVHGLWCCLIPSPPGYAAAMAARVLGDIVDVRAAWGLPAR
ncbi:4'-phosphopantetheinyl transferase family protein [Nesterenkonia cremea]|uniref:4'-phosphopantetheinyl transferase domain-containing protein n=1 Tax=Nesterenkonia cremea TaxID=1882340 RepID=A0A917ALH9_9MICC|nr:4'-phosphopantetheinyl transferase family protein [Nesterenkonia cremea]GGE59759.1 hypothetical protein GCM10011401_03280 [Nesterenkonia cremea]